MLKSTARRFLLVCLPLAQLWAATDPFVGKWKLNPSRSTFVDEIKVEPVGANQYRFIFTGSPGETIVADGTDQPGISGTTFSATIEDPRTWKVTRKQGGHTLLTATWKLSEDGRTLRDAFTTFKPDGSPSTVELVYQRKEGTSGFTGAWENNEPQFDSSFEIQVQPYEADGLTFVTVAQHTTRNVRFDGKEYPNPGVAPGFTVLGRRKNERALQLTEKRNGELVDTREISISPDGKSLTMAVRQVGSSKPTILVFEKE